MTRQRFLIEILDEGVAIERWAEDGHTEACFEAADGLHRVVAAQAAGQTLEEDLVADRALLDACPLCRADLRDAVALVQGFDANVHRPLVEAAPVEAAPSAPSARLSASVPEPDAALRFGEVQHADRPAPTWPDAQPSPAATAHPSRGRFRNYIAAAVAVACVAGATLALVWQQQRTSRSQRSPGVEERSPGANGPTGMTSPPLLPMTMGPSRASPRAPSSGRAMVPVMHRAVPSAPAMGRAPAPPPPMTTPAPVVIRRPPPGPDPKAQRYGYLRINTLPRTRIWIDGQLRGSTPQLKLMLRPGRHKLELINRRESIYYTAHITIRPNKATTIVKKLNRP